MAQRRKMTRYVENKIVEMLYAGNTLTNTCETLDISRMTEWKHRKKKKGYRERVDAALETRTEVVEDALYTTALSGVFAAQRFFLINRGKPRWRSEFGVRVEDDEGPTIEDIDFTEIVIRRRSGA